MNTDHTLSAPIKHVPPLIAPQHDSIEDIMLSEPPVARIIAEARAAYRPGKPTDWSQYNRLRRELEQYVGWGARRSQLRNAAVWTIAHSAMVDAVEGGQR